MNSIILIDPGNKKTFGLVVFLLLIFPFSSNALDITSNSCAKSDVQAAIVAVQNSGGGTVYIPPGDCTWDGGGYAGVSIRGNVNIIGAGINSTILRVTDGSAFFNWNYYTSTKTEFFRLSGIKFYSDLGCTSGCNPSSAVSYKNTKDYRIDNNHFEGYFDGVLGFKSVSRGLIDNNVFINNNIAVSGSYYGITAGSPYDGGPPSPLCKTVGDPKCLPRCDVDICTCNVGEPSSNRASSVATGKTVISSVSAIINNPGGSGTGKVQRLYVNIATADATSTINVASFSRSGNVFTARARAANIPVKQGLNIIAADDGEIIPFDINNGDYIGVYLNNATLEAATGSTGWSFSGDQTNQSNVDFGTPNIGAASVYAELFDNEGAYGSCDNAWAGYYVDTTRGLGYYIPFNRNWVYDQNAHYIENNTFTWYKSVIAGNWGGSAAFVVRHNTFYSSTGQLNTFTKPGNNFIIWDNNVFEYTGANPPSGYVNWINTDGLFFNNTVKKYQTVGTYEMYRNFSDHSFPFFVRPKEIYIWNNKYENTGCNSDATCWVTANEGTYWMNQPGENGSIHFRAPQNGDRLYPFTTYTYPHPLTGGVLPPPPVGQKKPNPPAIGKVE